MLISEIYPSIQGEGALTGTPSIFVRTSGCNLRCDFCDTPFASWNPTGETLTVNEIFERVAASAQAGDLPPIPQTIAVSGSQAKAQVRDTLTDSQVADSHLPESHLPESIRHVVLTGGEPLLTREINELCAILKQRGFHLTIETAGTIFRELDCDLMSISPKLSNSDPEQSRAGAWRLKHQTTRHRPDIVRQLLQRYDYQLKFVVDQPDDISEILSYLDLIQPVSSAAVMLMPQGIEQAELVAKADWLQAVCDEHGFTFCPRKHIEWFGNRRGT